MILPPLNITPVTEEDSEAGVEDDGRGTLGAGGGEREGEGGRGREGGRQGGREGEGGKEEARKREKEKERGIGY